MAAICCFVISVYKQLKTQAAGFSKHCTDSLPPQQPVHREQIFLFGSRAWFPVSLLKNPVHERSGLRCCVSVCTLKHHLKHYNWVIQPKMNKRQNNTVIYLTKTNLKKCRSSLLKSQVPSYCLYKRLSTSQMLLIKCT